MRTRQFGRFDVWVNNAGWAAPYGPALHISPGAFLRTVNTNIVGTYHGSLVAMRAFLPEAAGKLINVLGRGSDGRAVGMQTAYAASKAWVRSFTANLAADYKDSGVGIYGINPGMMTTDMLTDLEVVSGYEKRLTGDAHRSCGCGPSRRRCLRKRWSGWRRPPPTARPGWMVSQMGPGTMAGGALREGVRRVLRRPAEDAPMSVQPCRRPCRCPTAAAPARGREDGERSMTYFGFLIRFIGVPLLIMALLTLWDAAAFGGDAVAGSRSRCKACRAGS